MVVVVPNPSLSFLIPFYLEAKLSVDVLLVEFEGDFYFLTYATKYQMNMSEFMIEENSQQINDKARAYMSSAVITKQ